MHGDFSLNPLNWRENVSRVLYQMGRVQLDSDINEHTESMLRYLRGLAVDVIGCHGGVAGAFRIIDDPKGFRIGWGDYYVDGICCRNWPEAGFWQFIASPELRKKADDGLLIGEHTASYLDVEKKPQESQLLYLAVWERHVSAAENDDIREVALSGIDTTSRAVVVWQIRMMPAQRVRALAEKLKKELELRDPDDKKDANAMILDPVYLALNLVLRSSARLRAMARTDEEVEPCAISPESAYRGPENRLYRVEIHDPGDEKNAGATYKWSADNGSIVYPVRSIDKTLVSLESLGRDERTSIRRNDWVEVVDDEITLRRKHLPLLKVVDVDRQRMTVTLEKEPDENAGSDRQLHPILRRWATDAVPVRLAPENNATDKYDELEDGVQVQFSAGAIPHGGLRSGDYWLIPARVATGDVVWPRRNGVPSAVPPHGIDEHYAPLAVWQPEANSEFQDLRWRFDGIAKPAK